MDRTEWLVERAKIPGCGASESSALFGLNPYLSAFALFERLVNPQPITDDIGKDKEDRIKRFGLSIEAFLAEEYSIETGRKVELPPQPLQRMADKPYIFASLDRVCSDDKGGTGVLELKSDMHFSPEQELPPHWEIQGQHQCLVSGLNSVSFSILGSFRNVFHCDDIPANPAFHEILIERIELFMLAVHEGSWGRFETELDSSTATSEALRRLYRNETGETVKLGEEFVAWVDKLAKAKADIAEAEKREAQAKNTLIAAIGNNTFAELPDGRKFSFKMQKRAEYVAKASEFRVLRLQK